MCRFFRGQSAPDKDPATDYLAAMFERLKSVGRGLKGELRVYKLAIRHPKTPRLARFLLWGAVAYALMPFDLIPDFIPVVGHLDDAVIIPLLVILALRMIPAEVMDDCRRRSKVSDGAPE